MKLYTALNLLYQYDYLVFRPGGFEEPYAGLWDRFHLDGSEAKAMRWLGFAQGACVAFGIFTLEEVKRHSQTGTIR